MMVPKFLVFNPPLEVRVLEFRRFRVKYGRDHQIQVHNLLPMHWITYPSDWMT